MRLVLASSSPRRAQLLRQIGLDFDVVATETDETRYPGEDPETYVERVARSKAGAIAGADRLVVAGDTAVVFEGRVMGKPGHPDEARSMLARLQGKTHDVFTAIAVATVDDGVVVKSLVDVAEVEILPMTVEEIGDYVDTGEPFDKAGAYALQGRGGQYVARVIGHPATVIGLPIHLLGRLVAAVGQELSAFAQPIRD